MRERPPCTVMARRPGACASWMLPGKDGYAARAEGRTHKSSEQLCRSIVPERAAGPARHGMRSFAKGPAWKRPLKNLPAGTNGAGLVRLHVGRRDEISGWAATARVARFARGVGGNFYLSRIPETRACGSGDARRFCAAWITCLLCRAGRDSGNFWVGTVVSGVVYATGGAASRCGDGGGNLESA